MARASTRFRTTIAAITTALFAAAPTVLLPVAASPAQAVVVVGVNVAATAEAVLDAGGEVDRFLDSVGGVAARLTGEEQKAVAAHGLAVVPDARVSVTSTGFDEHGRLVQIAALNPSTTDRTVGAGVGVALIDTGVAASPELDGRIIDAVDLTGEGDGTDRYGHGTFMAGLIVGSETGVAPGAHVVSVKVADADGSTDLSTVLDGFDFVVETRDEFDTRVLSVSLAVESLRPAWVDPLAIAAEYATSHGVLVVAASGNTSGTVTSPGIAASALTVGATDHADTATVADDTIPSWSGSDGVKPEVVAPGVATISVRAPGSVIDVSYPEARIGENHFRGSGTSMATALTAGAAAVIAEQAPDATPADLKAMIVNGASAIEGGHAVDLTGAETAAADTTSVPALPVAGTAVAVVGADVDWSGTRWAGTRWAGTRWAGTRWADTEWVGTRWAGTRWAGTRWAGTRWAGTRWAGDEWAGTRWAGTRWAGTRWAGDEWAGTRWAGTRWAGTRWAGTRWAGDEWAGTRWAGTRWAGTRWASSDYGAASGET